MIGPQDIPDHYPPDPAENQLNPLANLLLQLAAKAQSDQVNVEKVVPKGLDLDLPLDGHKPGLHLLALDDAGEGMVGARRDLPVLRIEYSGLIRVVASLNLAASEALANGRPDEAQRLITISNTYRVARDLYPLEERNAPDPILEEQKGPDNGSKKASN